MDDAPPTLSLPSDYLAELIVTTRGVQAKEGEVDPGSGSNPADDKMWDVLQDDPEDLTRDEIRERLQGLTERQQAELVALMWGLAAATPSPRSGKIRSSSRVNSKTGRHLGICSGTPWLQSTGRKAPRVWASTSRLVEATHVSSLHCTRRVAWAAFTAPLMRLRPVLRGDAGWIAAHPTAAGAAEGSHRVPHPCSPFLAVAAQRKGARQNRTTAAEEAIRLSR